MFWRRDHRPPLSARQRVDLELLLRRTIETAGKELIQQATWVRNLDELALNTEDVSEVLRSANAAVKTRLPKPATAVEVEVVTDDSIQQLSSYKAPESAGTNAKKLGSDDIAKIQISDQLLADPLRLVIELAAQHSMHYWQGIEPRHPLDLTPLTTHLLPICFGFGFLASDASLYDSQWSLVGYSGWTLSRSGYYTAEEIGYSLAVLSRIRPNLPKNWHQRLRPDSRETALKALKWFEAQDSSATLFDADQIPSSKCQRSQLTRWLKGDCPDFKLAAIEAMLLQNEPTDDVEADTMEITRSKAPSLVHAATKLLGRLRTPSEKANQRLSDLIRNRDVAIAIEAIHSAIATQVSLVPHAKTIGKLLDYLGVHGQELTQRLSECTVQISTLSPVLCRQIDQALSMEEWEWALSLIQCLQTHSKRPAEEIKQYCRFSAKAMEVLEQA